MLVTYLRSSSYSAYDFCPHSYFLQYCLDIPSPAGMAADKGNLVHKALELLARKKLALQRMEPAFHDPETGEEFGATAFTPEDALAFSWGFHTQVKKTPHRWTAHDRRDCEAWMRTALEYNGGQFSPLKRTVLAPEQYFDLEIRDPWARYSYELPDGNTLEGHLALKGAMDLVTELDEDTIEYIDWKSGRRLDWATGKEKTNASLRADPQIRLYHYALCRLYPARPNVIMTVFYLRDGGPYSLCLGRGDLPETLAMIKARFEEIRDTQRPALNRSWKCERLCHYGRTAYEGGGGPTICDHFRDEVLQVGTEGVFRKCGDASRLLRYGAGGGKSG